MIHVGFVVDLHLVNIGRLDLMQSCYSKPSVNGPCNEKQCDTLKKCQQTF